MTLQGFLVPRPMLMLDTNSHYTTYTNATLEYLQRTVQPDVTEMEQEFNRKLLRREDFGRRRIHMCEQPLLVSTRKAQAKVDQLQLQTGAALLTKSAHSTTAHQFPMATSFMYRPTWQSWAVRNSTATPNPLPNLTKNHSHEEVNRHYPLQYARTDRDLHPFHPQGGM